MFQTILFTAALSSDAHTAIQDAHPRVVGTENYGQGHSENCSNKGET